LVIQGLRKVYGANVALADVDVSFAAGEIHGLLGENGAGKSTLIKILAGVVAADAGTITANGKSLDPLAAGHVKAAGIQFIHQDLGLVESLTIAENVALAIGYEHRFSGKGPISWAATRRKAETVLRRMGLELDVETKIEAIGIGVRATVAIARAIASEARVLILDEATATLAAGEVQQLFAMLRRLRDNGVAIVFVSHRMDEILALCDRVTVLRDGRVAGTRSVTESAEAEIVELIIGRKVNLAAGRQASVAGGSADRQPIMRVTQLEGVAVGPLDFELFPGEIFGVTGLEGAGQREIADIVFGIEPAVAGEMRIEGRSYRPRSPHDAVMAGLAFLPADRAGSGLALLQTVAENLDATYRETARAGRGSPAAGGHRRIIDAIREFDVRPPEPDMLVGNLSGGNAQKVLLARVFGLGPKLLVLNEPTAGVDVGAREQIYRIIRNKARSEGLAVLVVSGDLEEMMLLCDRVIVLKDGHVAARIHVSDSTVAQLIDAAVGLNIHADPGMRGEIRP